MRARAGTRGRIIGLLTAAVMLWGAAGSAWATSHVVPPPSALRQAAPEFQVSQVPEVAPREPMPGWQAFVTYREALRWFGGAVLALMVVAALSHLAVYGYHHLRPTGRLIRRYTAKEVLLHALLALAFVGAWASSTYLILAKHVLGRAANGAPVALGRLTSTAHIAAGLVFFGALVGIAMVWRRSMRFAPYDPAWLRELGGYFTRGYRVLPAGRFNAGQKVWFYVSVLLGLLVAATGALIYFPALFGPRASIVVYVAHTALAVALSAAVIIHVYLAVLVHPHAMRAVLVGTIDEACLREDHPLEIEATRR